MFIFRNRVCTIVLLMAAWADIAGASDYLKDIKPLLQHKCYACHGALKQQGGLRLDTAASLTAGGESGPALHAGKPQDSLLIDVLTGDAGFQMPPANEGAPMTRREIQLIRDWISAGADAPKNEQPAADPKLWWSYQPIARPPIPNVQEADWSRNEIDHFVAATREANALPHAAEAPKATWLRRVFLNLIGLPPTREELQSFLADESATAYESVVDDLLSRPQYGERWGRHWMDVWRYSDWYGSRGINEIRYSQRHIWRWRDWIVESLNKDKGYGQMIREMLSADEIAGDDPSVLPATGYLGRNWYKFDRNVWMFETVERTGEAFLGLTLRCCRCHDHKFDPVSQEEYYRFRAFFEPHDVRTDPVSALTKTKKDATLGQVLTDGIALVYDKEPETPTYRFERGDNRYPDKSKQLTPGVPSAFGGELNVEPVKLTPEAWYPMLRPEVRKSVHAKADEIVAEAKKELDETLADQKLAARKLADLAKSEANSSGEPEVFLADDFSAANPEVWKTINGTWKHQDGKLVQSAVTSFATITTQQNHPGDFQVHLRYRPLSPGTYRSVGFSFDYQDKGNSQDVYTSTGDERQSVQAFHRTGGKQVYPRQGIVRTDLKVGEEAVLDVSVTGSKLIIKLNGEEKLDYLMPIKRRDGKFALWVHQGAAEFLSLKITKLTDSKETLEQRKLAADEAVAVAQAAVRLANAEANALRLRLAADVSKYLSEDVARAKKNVIKASTAELAVEVLKAELELLQSSSSNRAALEKKLAAAREAAKKPSENYQPVGEQFPKTSTGRRRGLADWIANASNPRTARVAANHIWGRHFGRPLVTTPENFGLNGRKPTHPELLDWLASELIRHDWKMKPLHRSIVLSATYRMSTKAEIKDADPDQPTPFSVDPDNKFFWRMNSRRMEAEVVRDSTLYLAKQLDLTRGGPEISESEGEKNRRRSLYFRNTPNEKMPMLEIFDVADPNACYRRKESVVPHQSLALMNSGLTQDQARLIAKQLAEESDFVLAAFETVLSRAPTDAEAKRSQEFLDEHALLLKKKNMSERFSGGGTASRAPADDPLMRAKENLVLVLFLHNEFVTIR